MGPGPHRTCLDRADETPRYTKFVAQGGDWGAVITELMGVQAPPELLGIHTNMANVIPLDIDGQAIGTRFRISPRQRSTRSNIRWPDRETPSFGKYTAIH